MSNFININIGHLIQQRVLEKKVELSRICNFFNCKEEYLDVMYHSESLETELVLKWSKLLEYDFFRIYSQHLILYSPSSALEKSGDKQDSQLPTFRKNIYTKEIIEFILEEINEGTITKKEAIIKYRIPKTTL